MHHVLLRKLPVLVNAEPPVAGADGSVPRRRRLVYVKPKLLQREHVFALVFNYVLGRVLGVFGTCERT